MRITIPDDLAEQLADGVHAPQVLEEEIARRLRMTLDIPLGARFLTLTIAQLDRIGMALGRSLPPLTADQICAYAERNASLKLGEIRIDFTAGQLEEIQRLAGREGRDVANFVGRIAQAILTSFFRTPPFQQEGLIVTRTIVEEVEVPARAPALTSAPTA